MEYSKHCHIAENVSYLYHIRCVYSGNKIDVEVVTYLNIHQSTFVENSLVEAKTLAKRLFSLSCCLTEQM